MVMKFTNNAVSTLASGITNVATSLTVQTGQGALFPSLGGGDYFYCTLENLALTREIVKVTARSGDVFTIVRGQDGTSGVAWNSGDKVELRIVAASLNDIPKLDETNSFSVVQSFAAGAVGTPSIYLSTDTTSGLYRIGTNNLGVAISGAKVLDIASGGLGVTGTLSATGVANFGTAAPPTVSYFKHLFVGNAVFLDQNAASGEAHFGTGHYYNGGYKSRTTGPAYQLSLGEVSGQISLDHATAAGTADTAITFTKLITVTRDKSLALQGATPQTGAGITFPATQSASTDPNTLDDYEEGTWTPSQGAGLTVVGAFSSGGRYVKIGRSVTVTGYVAGATSVAVAANTVLCGTLPFAGTTGVDAEVGSMINATLAATGCVNVYSTTLYATAMSASARLSFTVTYNI